MLGRSGVKKWQEQIGVQFDVDQITIADDDAIETASTLWQELQQDQNVLLDRQELVSCQNVQTETSPGQEPNQHPNAMYVYVDDINRITAGLLQIQHVRPTEDDNGSSDESNESQIDFVPGLAEEHAMAEMGITLYKEQWLGSVGYPRDPRREDQREQSQ